MDDSAAFIDALKAVMKMQQTLLQLSDLGPMSPMNSKITYAQLRQEHARVTTYLDMLGEFVESL